MAFNIGGALSGGASGASAGSSFGPWGAVIGGGIGALAGGFMGEDEVFPGGMEGLIRANVDWQREFAQHGVRWRVEDAKAAGLHPLFALGANVQGFQPISVGGRGDDFDWSNFGQDISRAIESTRTEDERVRRRLQELAVEKGELEIEFLKARTAKLQADQVGPPMASINEGLGPGIKTVPVEIQSSMPDVPSVARGVIPPVRWQLESDGALTPIPAEGLIDDQDITNIGYLEWLYRNRLLPSFEKNMASPPRSMLPEGATHWEWSRTGMRWYPSYSGTSRMIEGR